MNWRACSIEDALDELSRAISAQVTRATEALEGGTDPAAGVHEARRAIKRARALLRLVRPWPADSRIETTLREASQAIAMLRDADVVVLTTEDIEESFAAVESNPVPSRLVDSLKEERARRLAEAVAEDGPLSEARDLLKSVQSEVGGLKALELASAPTASNGAELLRLGLGASYASVRERSDPTVGDGPADRRSHKLRKRVKDLRYQLEFLDRGQPGLGRLVGDLYHLTDLLGDANDLATLSACAASADFLSERERGTLTAHVEERKQVLRSEAAALSARLFEEDPSSFLGRVEAWVTPPQG